MKRGRFIFGLIFAFILIVSLATTFAVDDLLSLQGNVKEGGANLALGNLTVVVYDTQTAGNLIYNSSDEFNDAVIDGKYDVMLGNSSTNELSLEYGKLYYLEIFVNNEKFSFNNSGARQVFQSSVGQVNGTYISVSQINSSHLGFAEGENLTLPSGSWFKGMFNWIITGNSSHYLNFNGTTLVFDEARLNATIDNKVSLAGANSSWNETYADTLYGNIIYGYNQSLNPVLSNIFNQDLNTTNNVLFSDLNVTNVLRVGGTLLQADTAGTLNITGTTNFNGGWRSGGVTVSGGNLFAQTIFVYNITSLAVNDLEINGSLIPDLNNTFDIGNITQVYRNIYLSGNEGDIYFGPNSVKQWLYNQTQSAVMSNIFNQDLNTTNNVVFENITSTGNLTVDGGSFLVNTNSGSTNVSITRAGLTNEQLALFVDDGYVNFYSVQDEATNGGFAFFLDGTQNADAGMQGNSFKISKSGEGGGQNLLTLGHSGNLSVNNTFYVSDNGKVGIGTANPGYIFDVNITPSNYARFFDDDGFGGLQIQGSNPIFALRQTDGNSAWFGVEGSSLSIENRTSALAWQSTPYLLSLNAPASTIVTTSAGNVGIGIANPQQTLNVVGTFNATGNSTFRNISADYYFGDGSKLTNVVATVPKTPFQYTATSIYNDTAAVNLGIGTAGPSERIDVQGGSTTFGAALLLNASTGSPASRASVILMNSGTVQIRGTGIYTFNNNETHNATWFIGNPRATTAPFSDAFIIGRRGGSSINSLTASLTEGGAPFVYISNQGNVGIGTNAPSNKLSVVGTGNITGGSATTQGLLVDSTGKVGIGTTNPQSKLNVVGTFNVTTNLSVGTSLYSIDNGTGGYVDIGGSRSNYVIPLNPSHLIVINNVTGARMTLLSGVNNTPNVFSAYQFSNGFHNNAVASLAFNQHNKNLGLYVLPGVNDTTSVGALVIEGYTQRITTNTSINIGFIGFTNSNSVPYNSFGVGTPSSGAGVISNQDDVFIKDDLEVDGTAYLAGGTAWTQGDIAENIETKASRENKLCNGDVSCYKENTNDDLDYGDLVCIDITESHTIIKCDKVNSTLAVGFVTNTSVLYVGPDTGYPISLAGIVWAHVTNEGGDIRPGDLLVSSSTPGYAMRNDNPKAGTIVAKAFDFCDKDECDIRVFVALS
ncbi:hypothetical protein J4477_00695 [Candidatus Pacearchaeota archaeon]|nr:hypothetical protein [Candidatus Pacearchaeota archaeon]